MTNSIQNTANHFKTAAAARQAIRTGGWTAHTSGLAPVNVQGNIVILPAAQAADFLRFCQANPKPCPLLAVSDVGEPFLPTLGYDVDIRSDVPAYRVYRNGVLTEDNITDIGTHWRDDLVTFVLGCSFSFEHALMEAGIPLRHVQQGRNVAMYKTNIATVAAGPFHGPLVVSMRPMKAADAIRAVLVTARTPRVHGAPVHIGNPGLIGIADLDAPDFGDAVEVMDDELPVFWACGVTPQAIVMATKPVFCITHAPGHMLITDLLNSDLPFA